MLIRLTVNQEILNTLASDRVLLWSLLHRVTQNRL